MSPLPRSRPADVGIPARALLDLLDDVEARRQELHSLVVVRHGRVAAEGWWAPYSADRIHLLYSLSKSFTSSAVGFCVAEGRFGLEDRVVDLLPDRAPAAVHPRVAELTVHHLLSMSTGHREDTLERASSLRLGDLVTAFLSIPPEEPVGSRHAYNNSTTYVLAALVERASGQPLLEYLRPRLLDPLGIEEARWDTDRSGQALGFSGLHLRTEAVAAYGQLLLQDGVWEGTRVLPEGWVALATRRHIGTDQGDGGPVDWRQGYGYQYWMSRHGYRGDGAKGQFCVVVPEHDLVVATTAAAEDMQEILDAVWERLLPALDRTDPDEEASERELAVRLESLALPTLDVPRPERREEATFRVESADNEAPFAPGTTVTARPHGPHHQLEIVTPAVRLSVPCGRDQWAEGALGDGSGAAPAVCRGGWTAPDTFEADLVLVETPHRIRLRGNGSGLTSAWNLMPLDGPRLDGWLRLR